MPEAELRKLLKLKKGDVFSREKLTESTKLIVDRLGNEGYAFANVNPVPEIDREKKQVAFTLVRRSRPPRLRAAHQHLAATPRRATK